MKQFLFSIYFLLLSNYIFSQEESVYSKKMNNFAIEAAKQLPDFLRQSGKKKIAVWLINDQEKINQPKTQKFSDALINDLPTFLFKQGLGIVDRQKIEAILSEQKMANIQNPETVKEFGNLIQADAILTGSYRITSNYIRVTINIQDVETNEIISTDIIEIPLNDEDIRTMLGLAPDCKKEEYTLRFIASSSWTDVYISRILLEIIPANQTQVKKQKDKVVSDSPIIKHIRVESALTVIPKIPKGQYYLLVVNSNNSNKVIHYKKIELTSCYDYHITTYNDRIYQVDYYNEQTDKIIHIE